MNFPDCTEIELNNPPIEEVICQIRFPKTLKISAEPPYHLQELINDAFPILTDEKGLTISNEKSQIVQQVGSTYRFASSDEKRSFTLASDFFALSFSNYLHWNEFIDQFNLCNKAIESCYSIPFTNRIGLRFINKIDYDKYGLKSFNELLEIFQPELISMVLPRNIQTPQSSAHRVSFADDMNNQLTFQYGKFIINENLEPSFMLDFDYFTEKHQKLVDILELLHEFHNNIYKAFRWTIKDERLSLFDRKE